MNNPFDYTPDAACQEAFKEMIARIDALREGDNPEDVNLCRELDSGKMLGVLIAIDKEGVRRTLYAFSGQLGDGGFIHRDFVEPVFDYLAPDGYFKRKEAEISCENRAISSFENEFLAPAQAEYDRLKERLSAEIVEYKEKCRRSKMERDAKRQSDLTNCELADLINQSRFEKAELRRKKKNMELTLEPLVLALQKLQAQLDSMKEKRRRDSEHLQNWLFSNFRLLNARGESLDLNEIFAQTNLKVPPSGAGECCAPKLLQAAYRRGWEPVSIAEYWYGKPKGGEIRRHGEHYPACRGKCLPVLSWMLKGLAIEPPLDTENRAQNFNPEIIFENEWFCVVNKPSGMLSIPGKGDAVSVERWLTDKFGVERYVKVAHRLDQDTSGLLIATFGENSFKTMQSLFATRKVKKQYVAILEGNYQSKGMAESETISLPLSPDWLDRPRQRVDYETGKEAITEYRFVESSAEVSRVIFHPQTGRTHQLRVHAASAHGLGMPIKGDRLYGKNGGSDARRLYLHAQRIEFTFPIDGEHYCFEVETPF